MCRVIGFLGSGSGVGKSTIVFELSKKLAERKFKVCVIDAYFNFNSLSLMFKLKNTCDLKEYLILKKDMACVLNKENDYLCFLKTNSSCFNYLKHKEDIENLLQKLSQLFDYVLIDINQYSLNQMNFWLKIIQEVFLIIDDSKDSVLKAHRIMKKLSLKRDILNVKIVMNKTSAIGQVKNLRLSPSEIEKFLKTDVLFCIPKFFKYNYFNYKKTQKKQKFLMEKFCDSFITNKGCVFDYTKHYRGVIGFFRRLVCEKFE